MRPVGLWTLAFMIGLAMLGPSVVEAIPASDHRGAHS